MEVTLVVFGIFVVLPPMNLFVDNSDWTLLFHLLFNPCHEYGNGIVLFFFC